jgi:hypothetical protein
MESILYIVIANICAWALLYAGYFALDQLIEFCRQRVLATPQPGVPQLAASLPSNARMALFDVATNAMAVLVVVSVALVLLAFYAAPTAIGLYVAGVW